METLLQVSLEPHLQKYHIETPFIPASEQDGGVPLESWISVHDAAIFKARYQQLAPKWHIPSGAQVTSSHPSPFLAGRTVMASKDQHLVSEVSVRRSDQDVVNPPL